MHRTVSILRAVALLASGLFSLALMALFVYFALRFLIDGAGLPLVSISVTPGGVAMGTVPFIGLVAAAGLSLLVGIGLCSYGWAQLLEIKLASESR